MAEIHPLTPWGRKVKMRLVELGLTANDLIDALKSNGIKVSRATVSGLLHGYRGSRSEYLMRIIDEILDGIS